MKFPKVPAKMARPLLHLQKNSPQVMFAGGAVAGVAGVVLACRATLKVSDTLQEFEDRKDKAEILFNAEHIDQETGEKYDEKTYHRDLVVIKAHTILAVTKLYAPSAALLMLSAGLLTGSHVTLNRRNAGLTAAYASVDQAFQQYRSRVKDQLGEEVDRDMRYGTRTDKETVEAADGKKKVVSHTRVDETQLPSQYARFFDKLCENWVANPEYNMIFLKSQQNYANQLLIARGHLFLNEVYDMLDIPRTGAGAMVGWLHDRNHGDGYVDFGIFDDNRSPDQAQAVRDFVNGREGAILLDFNVDGTVYDKIDGVRR